MHCICINLIEKSPLIYGCVYIRMYLYVYQPLKCYIYRKIIVLFLFQWNTICLELPHGSLKLVCSGLVMELKRQNRHIPALPIASAINERLNGLLPGLALEGGPADRALMFSEAARRDTFPKWPHMNYKYAKLLHNFKRPFVHSNIVNIKK